MIHHKTGLPSLVLHAHTLVTVKASPEFAWEDRIPTPDGPIGTILLGGQRIDVYEAHSRIKK